MSVVMAAGAMAVGLAGPALAKDRHRPGWLMAMNEGEAVRWLMAMNEGEAVRRCALAAQREASNHHYGRARVTEITRVRKKRDGYKVKGRIQVKSDHRGRNHRRYDSGKFKCRIRHGRVTDIDFSGIRTLH
jgi:hypothetical protein